MGIFYTCIYLQSALKFYNKIKKEAGYTIYSPDHFNFIKSYSMNLCVHSMNICVHSKNVCVHSINVCVHSMNGCVHSMNVCVHSINVCAHSMNVLLRMRNLNFREGRGQESMEDLINGMDRWMSPPVRSLNGSALAASHTSEMKWTDGCPLQ